jgi:ketosteroid isomerase-like protein
MNINEFVKDFLDKSNAYDTKNYLDKWNENAVLDDPSVGKVFKGHLGIQNYFESYFIGYKTQTRLVKLEISTNDEAHLEVEFTGEFPEGIIGGTFDLSFKNGKIDKAKANLI